MIRRLFLWASTHPFLAERLPRLEFVRRAVRRFVPGEELDDALGAARRFAREEMSSVLTLLGENVEAGDEAREVRDHYLGVLDEVAERGLPAELSVKLTQLGVDQDPSVARNAVASLCARAEASRSRIWIDMESSRYVDPTLELYRDVLEDYQNVAVCLQSYLYRTPDDLEALLAEGATIRLVKGAYAEPPDRAYPDRADVDAAYLRLGERLLDDASSDEGRIHGFATHDLKLVDRIRAEAEARGVDREAYEVQMLYGIRREAQRSLARQGARVRVLISYGPAWFPWYMRRLAERPANVGFLLRSLFTR